MGDGFFKLFFGGAFLLIVLAGAIMYYQMEAESEDQRAVREYMLSRGKAPLPASWRDKVGEGI
ncbi:MAG: hypothetical protein KDD69_19575 [Bdellovibrionales bacterium]|nr:hypothetical protein [Bdellovibrionales bacterium]